MIQNVEYKLIPHHRVSEGSWNMYVVLVQFQLVWGLLGVTQKTIRGDLTQSGQYQTVVAVDNPNKWYQSQIEWGLGRLKFESGP